MRIADGSLRILAFDRATRDVRVVPVGSFEALGSDAAFENAYAVLAYNRAGRDGDALDYEGIVARATRDDGERPRGFRPARDDDPAYDDWRVRAWPDDRRVASAIASPDPWEHARLGTAVAVVRDDAILLGERIAPFGNGAWQTPGGKPDPGESLVVAAARELEEETGLVAVAMRYATSQVDTMPETGVTWRTHFWVAKVVGDVLNREPDKCAGWAWFPLDALPEPLFAIDARTIAAIAAIAREGGA